MKTEAPPKPYFCWNEACAAYGMPQINEDDCIDCGQWLFPVGSKPLEATHERG